MTNTTIRTLSQLSRVTAAIFLFAGLVLVSSAETKQGSPVKLPAVSESAKSDYTKALILIVNAQSGKASLDTQIVKAQKEADDAMSAANAAVQAALQKIQKECGDAAQLDGDLLQKTGEFKCVEKKATDPTAAKVTGTGGK